MPIYRSHILVCGGTGCVSSGARDVTECLRNTIRDRGLSDEVLVVPTGCHGMCEMGPILVVYPEGTFYCRVQKTDVAEIVEEHIYKGRPVQRLMYSGSEEMPFIPHYKEIPFYGKQHRIALANCGYINPDNIEEYIARGGYEALGKALSSMTTAQVIDEVKTSGLRGRGGGGFPTGLKWSFCASAKGDKKYVICNADEGDPGAFMDRSVLEGDPHSIIEAMTICGYAIGATKGMVYIRAEYPLAVQRLQKAIQDAREMGLLGDRILGSEFSFDIQLRYGAGAFVCGEETALIRSLEGERGEPTSKPPFPAESGYWGKPSNVNNVETFACVPVIYQKGPEWFARIGTEKSKGTKVFALAGKVNNVGLVEVPMGTTLREVIFDIGGGIRDGKKFKAVQTGGPSGGCLTAKHLDTPIDFDNLVAAGSMMGSGGMIVIDEDNCMVSLARFYLEFTVEESCGKCTPCRVGNKRMHEILTKICQGQGTEQDLVQLRELAKMIKDTSLCGLGQTAPNPVLSTLEHFWDEYVAHVREKRCPAGMCKDLMKIVIDAEKCKGCTMCAKVCPTGAISGKVREAHVIDQEKCVKCGACIGTCKFGAISKQ